MAALVNAGTRLRVTYKTGKVLTIWSVISFWKWRHSFPRSQSVNHTSSSQQHVSSKHRQQKPRRSRSSCGLRRRSAAAWLRVYGEHNWLPLEHCNWLTLLRELTALYCDSQTQRITTGNCEFTSWRNNMCVCMYVCTAVIYTGAVGRASA
jgi:hypothetical protein